MSIAEELNKCSKSQLIDALLSLEGENVERVIEELITKEDSEYNFYRSRIDNIELDLIDESFGDPLPEPLCEETIIDLVKKITSSITSSKSGCKLLMQLYKKESLVLSYAPKLEIYFSTTFATDFVSYAKKSHKRDKLIALIYNFIIHNKELSGLALLKHTPSYLKEKEIDIIVDNLEQIPEKKTWVLKQIEILKAV